MTTVSQDSAVQVRQLAGVRVVRLAAFVRGQVIMAAWPRVAEVREAVAAGQHAVLGPTADGSYLVSRPVLDRDSLAATGETELTVLPAVNPRRLLEPDPAAAVGQLLRLPFGEVCAFVDAVGAALRAGASAELLASTSPVGDRAHRAVFAQLCGLFDGAAVRAMTEHELGGHAEELLDGWTAVPVRPVAGVSARLAEATPGLRVVSSGARAPLLRAVPTRQLHLTAGNSPVVPVTSLLWGWATKGACVVKPAAESAGVLAALTTALAGVDPSHPLARHTTLAYWRGGDTTVEDVLLAPGAFDRLLLWGSAPAVASVTSRAGGTDAIVMRPRHALSLIGRGAVGADLWDTARRGAIDSLVANQQACMSSLLHVVQGGADAADAYAAALAEVLACWDEQLPHRPTPRAQGALTMLRRGLLATAHWQLNGQWPQVSSAVVRHDGTFDLARHPGSRLVLVRATDDLLSVLDEVGPAVSNVGVAPDELLPRLRDHLAARGVDNVLPLGAAEQGYAGRPHDGMRVLSRLLRWVNG